MKIVRRLISIILILSFACMLSGCFISEMLQNLNPMTADGVPRYLKSTEEFVYEGHTYEIDFGFINELGVIVGDWHMVDESDYVSDTAYLEGYEYEFEIRIYGNDPERRFIYVEYYRILCHREDDPLPDFKDAQAIEKLVLQIGSENPQINSQAVIEVRSEIQEFADLCSQPQIEEMYQYNRLREIVDSLPMYVYFKDYPAYKSVGDIFISEDGSGGLDILDFLSSTYSDRDYIPMPAGSKLLRYLQ